MARLLRHPCLQIPKEPWEEVYLPEATSAAYPFQLCAALDASSPVSSALPPASSALPPAFSYPLPPSPAANVSWIPLLLAIAEVEQVVGPMNLSAGDQEGPKMAVAEAEEADGVGDE